MSFKRIRKPSMEPEVVVTQIRITRTSHKAKSLKMVMCDLVRGTKDKNIKNQLEAHPN
jgi:hypothetical protein